MIRVNHILVTALYALLIMSGDSLLAKAPPQVLTGAVTRVVDGDTLWVKSNNVLLKVRLIGMDAPEICQSGGIEAREALKHRTFGQTVVITYQRLDDYGRLLGRVDLGGEDIGRWMVSRGYAWSYAYRNYPGPYAWEQQLARDSRLGIFAQETPEIPRHFRKRHGSCFP